MEEAIETFIDSRLSILDPWMGQINLYGALILVVMGLLLWMRYSHLVKRGRIVPLWHKHISLGLVIIGGMVVLLNRIF